MKAHSAYASGCAANVSSLISIPAAACVLVACVVVSATLCDATDTDTRDGISRGTHTRRDRVWLSGDMHLHSYHSADAPNNPSQTLVRLARERGLDFLSFVDHDNYLDGNMTASWTDPFFLSSGLILLYGVEWTTGRGHANFFGASPWDHEPLYKLHDGDGKLIAEEARRQGLVFTANHPTGNNPWQYGYDIGLDGLEIWNQPFKYPWDNRVNTELWESLMDRGIRVTARSGSDCHSQIGEESLRQTVGTPTNWILARNASAPALLEAFKEGRVTMSYAATSERVELYADTDGDSTFETLMGDSIPANGLPLSLLVHIHRFNASKKYTVNLFKNSGLHRTWIQTSPDFTIDDLPLQGQRTRYRVEVRGETPDAPKYAVERGYYGDMIGITNPIYVGF